MLTGPMTPMDEIREIQEGMARLRHDLHGDVQGVVEEARAWTDWARFVRQRPLLVLGAVAAIGYVIVPRRRREPPPAAPAPMPAFAPVAASLGDGDAGTAPTSSKGTSRGRGPGMLRMAFGLVSPILVRAAQNYAIQWINQWMVEWQEAADRSLSRGPQDQPRGPVARRPGAGG